MVWSYFLDLLCVLGFQHLHTPTLCFPLQTGQFIFLFHIISWLCVAAQSCLLSSTAILGIWHFISAVFSFIWASKGPMSLQWWVSLLFTSLDRSTSCFVFLNIFLRWICLHAAQRVELLPEPLRLHKTVEEKYIQERESRWRCTVDAIMRFYRWFDIACYSV